jgi:predicted nucleotidyltransferase
VASPERIQEVETFIANLRSWAAGRADVVAVAIVGSWARDGASEDSDIDVVLLTDNPSSYLEGNEWIAGLAPTADLLRTGEWGAIEERRLLLPSGLEIEVGLGLPSWADTAPVDPGTRAVVRDGLRALFDPRGLLAKLVAACRGST